MRPWRFYFALFAVKRGTAAVVRVDAHQPNGVQVDEFHLRLFGVLRVVWLGFINPVAQFMGCNALLCLVVGNGHPAFPLTGHGSSICCASRVLCVISFFTIKDSCAIFGQKDGVGGVHTFFLKQRNKHN